MLLGGNGRTPEHAGCLGSVAGTASARAAMRGALAGSCAAALLLASPQAVAQTQVYKCTDGKQVTYSSTPCEKLELKSAGAISDRITVISGDSPLAKPPPAKAGAEDEEARKSPPAKPIDPLLDRPVK